MQRSLTIRDARQVVKHFVRETYISSFYVQSKNYKFDLSSPGAPTACYSVSVYAAEGRVLIENDETNAAESGGTRIHEKSIKYPGGSTYRVRATRLDCF
jgi:hypothetical protein